MRLVTLCVVVAVLAVVISTRSAAGTSPLPPAFEHYSSTSLGAFVARVTNEAKLTQLKRKLVATRRRLYVARKRQRQLKRTLLHSTSVHEAIALACTVYGSCSTLDRRARCESTYSPTAYNRSSRASGLFQFIGSTWHSTPFAGFSVWSPYANALAAGWMQANGRGGEWQCR